MISFSHQAKWAAWVVVGVAGTVFAQSHTADYDADEIDPVPVVNQMNQSVNEIGQILQDKKPTNDKLVIRCVAEKLESAKSARSQAVAAIPLLRVSRDPIQAMAEAATMDGGGVSKPKDADPRAIFLTSAETVEKNLVAAKLCSSIQSGETVSYTDTQPMAGEAGTGGIDIPDFANVEPIPVESPVSRVR